MTKPKTKKKPAARKPHRQVEVWPVGKLKPYERNPRTHSDEQVKQIAASIAEFGFTNPILVDSKAGVIAGHGRLLAAQSLGLQEVPVIVLDGLTPSQKRAYVIADNKLALNAGWDWDVLAAELDVLREDDFNIALIGLEKQELNDLIGTAVTFNKSSQNENQSVNTKLEVIAECKDEEEQEQIFNLLKSKGIACRVLSI